MAFMAVLVGVGMFRGGWEACKTQKELAASGDEYKRLTDELIKESKDVHNSFKIVDDNVLKEILDLQLQIVDAGVKLRKSQKAFKVMYAYMQVLIFLIIITVIFLLIFKRYGILTLNPLAEQ